MKCLQQGEKNCIIIIFLFKNRIFILKIKLEPFIQVSVRVKIQIYKWAICCLTKIFLVCCLAFTQALYYSFCMLFNKIELNERKQQGRVEEKLDARCYCRLSDELLLLKCNSQEIKLLLDILYLTVFSRKRS